MPPERLHGGIGAELHRARRGVLRHAHRGDDSRVGGRPRGRAATRGPPAARASPRSARACPRACAARPGDRPAAARTCAAAAPTPAPPRSTPTRSRARTPPSRNARREVVHDRAEPLAFRAQQVPGRHARARRNAGAPCPMPTSPSCASGVRVKPGVSRSISSSEMPRAPRRCRIGAHGHRIDVGPHARGDEGLLAVHDVVVAVASRRGAQGRDVRAAGRLGDRERGNPFAGEDLAAARVAATRASRARPWAARRSCATSGRRQHAARPALRQLDADNAACAGIGVRRAAVFLGKPQTEQPGRGRWPYSSRGKPPASSQRPACGSSSRATNRRTVSRNAMCSGVSRAGLSRRGSTPAS